MSTPDANLSAAERAALAGLEQAAAAEDPHLASRLSGSSRSGRKWVPLPPPAYLVGGWVALLRLGWWGLLIALAGLAVMVLGLSIGLAVSAGGAVVCALGLRIVAQKLLDHRVE